MTCVAHGDRLDPILAEEGDQEITDSVAVGLLAIFLLDAELDLTVHIVEIGPG